MSIVALSWAFRLPLKDPTAKAVLIALADHLNDETGRCDPSMARLCLFTGLSDKAVRLAAQRLVDLKVIGRAGLLGRLYAYTLNLNCEGVDPGTTYRTPVPRTDPPPRSQVPDHPGTSDRPPRHDVPTTPVPHTDKPLLTLTEPLVEPLVDHGGINGKPGRKSQLPPTWRPGPEGRQYAIQHGHDPDTLVVDFRDYWIGKGEGMADWSRVWQRWCRSPLNRPRNNGNYGGGNGAAVPERGGGVVAAAERLLRRRGLV